MKRLAIALVGGVSMALVAVGTHPASKHLGGETPRQNPVSVPSVTSR